MNFTQEQLKDMAELRVPEYIQLGDNIYYCPYTTMFTIWHKIGENPNFPEWNYIDKVPRIKYYRHTGRYKPIPIAELKTINVLEECLKKYQHHGTVIFEYDEHFKYIFVYNKYSDNYQIKKKYTK